MLSRSAKSNERARVSKDEDGHGVGPHASRCIAAQRAGEASVLASRCDAPQHEGAATHHSSVSAASREAPPAAVRKDRRRDLIVSDCYLQ